VIVAVVGPSGAGKDTLIRGVCAARPDWRRVRRVITRSRSDETEDFEAVKVSEFNAWRAAGMFALDWEAHGLMYGIPRSQIEGAGVVLFNGSRAALPEARRRLADLRVIVVTAPAPILAARLAARGRETQADIQERIERSRFLIPEFLVDAVILNDTTPEEGVQRLLNAIQPRSA